MSQSNSDRSCAKPPRSKVCMTWVWPLTRPGITSLPVASIVSSLMNCDVISLLLPMPTIRPSAMAMAPLSSVLRSGSIVRTVPFDKMRSQVSAISGTS